MAADVHVDAFTSRLALLFQHLDAAVIACLSRTRRRRYSIIASSSSGHILSPSTCVQQLFDQILSPTSGSGNNRGRYDDRDLAAIAQLYCKVIAGNGTPTAWFGILLSCKLIVSAITTDARTPLCVLIKGFQLASHAAIHELSTIACSFVEGSNININNINNINTIMTRIFSWSDLENVLAVIKTSVLSSHRFCHGMRLLSAEQLDHISLSFLTAFLSSVDTGEHGSDTNTCNIVYRHATGLPFESMLVLEGTLAMDIPVPTVLLDAADNAGCSSGATCTCTVSNVMDTNGDACAQRKSTKRIAMSNLVVALFENSLELPEISVSSVDVPVVATTATATAFDNDDNMRTDDSLKSVELSYLDNIASWLDRSHVTLVACQRRVHPHLFRALNARGILCLQRLSIRYCGALQRLSGARQLVSLPCSTGPSLTLDPLDPDCLGYLGRVDCRLIYGKRYVVVCAHNDDEATAPAATTAAAAAAIAATVKAVTAAAISRRVPLSSVVVAAPSELLCEQLECALDGTRRVLMALLAQAARPCARPCLGPCRGAVVVRGGGHWQRVLAARLQQMFLRDDAPTTKTTHHQHPPHLPHQQPRPPTVVTAGAELTVAGGRDVRDAALLFADCLRRCGDAYGIITHPRQSCLVDHTDTARPTHSDSTNSKEEAGWEALSPYKDALALAVEAATCILTLDCTDPVVVANPLELRK